MREVESRPQGSGRCVAESRRMEIIRVSFDQTFQSSGYILIFNITISLLSRNGQHGMDQWVACSLLSECEWDVIGSPAMLFAAGLYQ